MNNEQSFLSIRDLKIEYVTSESTVHAVNNVSFDVGRGETLGLVGETGAGKTTIARAILQVLSKVNARICSGEIMLDGADLLKLSEPEMCEVRGNTVTMIFQDPMTSLNPVMTVGKQIAEVVSEHQGISMKEARARAVEMLELVGIPAERYDEYPHQFSGGMKQRVVIAIALACDPVLLLADEPTTALDVTIQAQVLTLMRKLHERRNSSMILITHDLGVVARMCDSVAIIYAGEVVEIGSKEDIFDRPSHPYTKGLFGAVPTLESDTDRLIPIEGLPPDPSDLPPGCCFHPRCPLATEACAKDRPARHELSEGHFCLCHLFAKEGIKNA